MTSPVEHSPNSSTSEREPLWDVQEILAERNSISGENEFLVVWKTCWVPKQNVKPGPVLQRYRAAPKFKFISEAGDINWAVEPDTQLAKDVAKVQAVQRERQTGISQQNPDASTRAPASDDHRTPRKQLGSVAKRARGTHD
jgi:hypothetical protein